MELGQLAVPFVYGLIFFLGYPTQWLLLQLEPAPLTKNELIASNIVLILIWITYTQSVFVDPGTIPKDWHERIIPSSRTGNDTSNTAKPTTTSTSTPSTAKQKEFEAEKLKKARKWCSKCSSPKPPRAHHCKSCRRCIPKMDHHCPWTANCVSHSTFPHFLRFLLYTTLGLSLLQKFLFTRLYHLWQNRDMPSYLGPSMFQLGHLFTTLLVNSITLFALGILCIRNIWCLAVNTTTIEGWEIERHATLVRRARHFGGYLEAADGSSMVRIKHQEFPYDIGIWANIVQGMGSRNPINWFNPFAKTPALEKGLAFEVNGFEDEGKTWPPPDPDRIYRRQQQGQQLKAGGGAGAGAFTYKSEELSTGDTVKAFKERQAEDMVRRRKPFVDRLEERQRQLSSGIDDERAYNFDGEEESDDDDDEEENKRYDDKEGEGEESWRNSEGERLKDFGVDEDVEFYDEHEDDIPLAELIARRKAAVEAGYDVPYS